MKRLLCTLLALALLPSGAHGADLPAFRSVEDTRGIDEYERRLWGSGEEFDRLIARTSLVEDNPELTAYVQGVLDRLYPDLKGIVRVRILKSPMLNAFALPNGSIYINQGLLARFDNEAQLATVLAHEGAHFTHRHAMRLQDRRKVMSLIHLATSLLGLPYPWARDLLLMSSMFGYSRDMETEADNEGFKRMEATGYDLAESPRVFSHLLQELRASEIKEPFFFATHPKLQDRIDNYAALVKDKPPGGTIEREGYLRQFERTRLSNLENDLTMHRPMSVIAALDFGKRTAEYPPQAFHYLAEAFRQRARPGDEEVAEVLYRHCLSLAPDFAPPHFGLGVLQMKRGALAPAREHLRRYVEQASAGAQRGFAEDYLRDIDARLASADP